MVGRTLRCEENLPSTGTSSLTVSFFLGAMLDVSQWTSRVCFASFVRCGLGGGDATVLSLAHEGEWLFAWFRSIQPVRRWGTYRKGWVVEPRKEEDPPLSLLVSLFEQEGKKMAPVGVFGTGPSHSPWEGETAAAPGRGQEPPRHDPRPPPNQKKRGRTMDPHANLAEEIRQLECDIRKQGDVVRAKKAQKKDGLAKQVRKKRRTTHHAKRRNETRHTSEQQTRRKTIETTPADVYQVVLPKDVSEETPYATAKSDRWPTTRATKTIEERPAAG